MIPVQVMMSKMKEGVLGQIPKGGNLRHYHISLADFEGIPMWMQRAGKKKNIQRFFFKIK